MNQNLNKITNEKLFAMIAAACFGVVVLLTIIWMVSEIQNFYGVGSFFWIIQYLLIIAGVGLVGTSLFLPDAKMLSLIGAGIAGIANLIPFVANIYYFFQYPSLGQFIWILIWLLYAALWGLVLFTIINKDRKLDAMLRIVAIAAVAVVFILDLIMRFVGYSMGYYDVSFFAIFWKVILYNAMLAVGIVMAVLVITFQREAFAPIPGAKAPQPNYAGRPQQPIHTNRFCAQCGARLESDARFCENCGAPVRGR